jgi:hypothetical protein
MQLSPLNFRGLIATLGIVGEPVADAKTSNRPKPRAIECWRCSECREVHSWESEAEECCADEDAKAAPTATDCPVCAAKYSEHRDAADCCLWKDIDAPTRYRMADAVEAGSTWVEQLGLTPNVELTGRPAPK